MFKKKLGLILLSGIFTFTSHFHSFADNISHKYNIILEYSGDFTKNIIQELYDSETVIKDIVDEVNETEKEGIEKIIFSCQKKNVLVIDYAKMIYEGEETLSEDKLRELATELNKLETEVKPDSPIDYNDEKVIKARIELIKYDLEHYCLLFSTELDGNFTYEDLIRKAYGSKENFMKFLELREKKDYELRKAKIKTLAFFKRPFARGKMNKVARIVAEEYIELSDELFEQ